jgi:hypothetical protein
MPAWLPPILASAGVMVFAAIVLVLGNTGNLGSYHSLAPVGTTFAAPITAEKSHWSDEQAADFFANTMLAKIYGKAWTKINSSPNRSAVDNDIWAKDVANTIAALYFAKHDCGFDISKPMDMVIERFSETHASDLQIAAAKLRQDAAAYEMKSMMCSIAERNVATFHQDFRRFKNDL